MKKCDSCGKVLVNEKDYMCPFCGAVSSKKCDHHSHMPDDRYNRVNDYYSNDNSEKKFSSKTEYSPKPATFGDFKSGKVVSKKLEGKPAKVLAVIIGVVVLLVNILTAVSEIDDNYEEEHYYYSENNDDFETAISYDAYAVIDEICFDESQGYLSVKMSEVILNSLNTEEVSVAEKEVESETTVQVEDETELTVPTSTENVVYSTDVVSEIASEIVSEESIESDYDHIDSEKNPYNKSLSKVFMSSSGVRVRCAIVSKDDYFENDFVAEEYMSYYYGFVDENGWLNIEGITDEIYDYYSGEVVVVIDEICVSTEFYEENLVYYGYIKLPSNIILTTDYFDYVTLYDVTVDENGEKSLSEVQITSTNHLTENVDDMITYY